MLRRSLVSALGAAALLFPTAALASTPPPESDRPAEPAVVEVAPEPAEGLFATEVAMSVDGRPAEIARAGVSIDVAVTLQNQSATTYADASATLTETSPGVTIERGSADIGTIAANGSAVARFRISIKADGCEDFAGLVFEVESTPAAPQNVQKIGVPVACPGPRLFISEIEWAGGDGDASPEPGETVTLTLGLANEGGDAATGVRGTLVSHTKGVEVLDADVAWPEIPSRESRTATGPLRVRIGSDVGPAGTCDNVPDIGVIEPAPAVDADDAVSSDGESVAADDPAATGEGSSSPGSAGAGAPGSPGEGEDPNATTTRDLPVEERRAEDAEPEPSDPPAAFELELKLVAAGDYQTTQYVGTQIYCAAIAERGKGGDPGAPVDEDASRHLAAESTGSTSDGGAAGWVAAGLVLVTGIAVLRFSLSG